MNRGEDIVHYTIDTEYDPRLELASYQFPSLDLLIDYQVDQSGDKVKNEELHANKDRIIENTEKLFYSN